MRRTVATLLVVASPLLLAAPVGAREATVAGPTGNPTPAAVVPAAPLPVATPAAPIVALPTAPAPVRIAPEALSPAVRPAVKAVRAKAPAPHALNDEAYAAQLRADLCQARAIFCGLDRSGHYPAG